MGLTLRLSGSKYDTKENYHLIYTEIIVFNWMSLNVIELSLFFLNKSHSIAKSAPPVAGQIIFPGMLYYLFKKCILQFHYLQEDITFLTMGLLSSFYFIIIIIMGNMHKYA